MATNSTKTSDEILHEIFQPATYVNGGFVQQPAFEKATLTPDFAIHTINLMKQTISDEEFKIHRNNYLRGSLQAIQKHQFDKKHTDALIDTVDWFVQKKPASYHRIYMSLLELMMKDVANKVEVPKEKQESWNQVFQRKKPLFIPSKLGLTAENAVQPSFVYAKKHSRTSR